jgi:hypothetical protein
MLKCLDRLVSGISYTWTLNIRGGCNMDRKKLMMTTVALGTAYLLKDQKSRSKVMDQLQSLGKKKKR